MAVAGAWAAALPAPADDAAFKTIIKPYVRGVFPKSPVNSGGTAGTVKIVSGATTTADGTTGWMYNTTTGEFICNSSTISPTDAVAMGVLTLAVIGAGTYSVVSTWCAVVAVLAAVALIALAVRQLLAETRQRMQEVIAVIERDAQPRPPEWKAAEGPDAGRTIRLD